MRRVYVGAPSLVSRYELGKRQHAVRSAADARSSWDNYRRSARASEVIQTLKDAAGVRSRCFYCSDSLAADIDHYIPITVDFGDTFDWKNFLWVCPVCNRKKGNRFPRSASLGPLLINPTREDPWSFLSLDTDTGVLAARFKEGDFDARGEATLAVLEPINYEAAVEGRMTTITRLREAIDGIPSDDSPARQINMSLKRLLEEVRRDDYGVSAWFGLWDGQSDPDFVDLAARNEAAWKRFVRYSHTVRYGSRRDSHVRR